MEKVRVGIIGLGNQGTHYMAGLFNPGKIPNGVITALCDNNPVKIEAMKARTVGQDVAYFDNYIDMLDYEIEQKRKSITSGKSESDV